MRKTLLSAVISIAPLVANAGIQDYYVAFERDPAKCTVTQFKQQVTDVSVMKGYTEVDISDNIASYVPPGLRNRLKSIDKLIGYYDDPAQPTYYHNDTKLQANLTSWANAKRVYTQDVTYWFTCAKPGAGIGAPNKAATNPVWPTVNMAFPGASDQYLFLEEWFPARSLKPTVFMFDTIIDRNFIYADHLDRFIGGASYINDQPTPISNTLTNIAPMHGNSMSFISMMMSQANVSPFTITADGLNGMYTYVDKAFRAAAAAVTSTNTPVINFSYSSSLPHTQLRKKYQIASGCFQGVRFAVYSSDNLPLYNG